MNKTLPNRAIEWKDGRLYLLDQRKLPSEVDFIECRTCSDVTGAIRNMVVRGAPAIGIAAAYGVVLSVAIHTKESRTDWWEAVLSDIEHLAQARPTAVNLGWALAAMKTQLEGETAANAVNRARQLASELHEADIVANRLMGQYGAELITTQSSVMTHCNAGALATGGFGTALGVVRAAHQLQKITNVYANETRPWFQGSRLTAWELMQENIPVTVTCDSAAASLLRMGEISWVIVGADRIAANGDVANKIGTYNLAVNARYHGLKFMVVAPTSTIDAITQTGADIPIERRSADEIIRYKEHPIGSIDTPAYNPVFDVTPAQLVDVLVTEKGILEQPDCEGIKRLLS